MKRVISSDNQGQSPKIFPPHNSSIWELISIFESGRAENDEIPKSSFPFQPITKTVKSSVMKFAYNVYE